ncbi:glycosyl hydrolase family 2 [Olivibacter sp. SDN3]|uniref:glycoside hydrolase family 2 TIM barrel-domain containing protein n=1 Tax=Olivibacter sp. SDN3 TaxID=2764720 RepID=UPI001651A488|nr:glycoside hydrolase family 2 TIM barrel-domain containing protein [Olivibacter sp. SDN3]QNL47842.1 glycosyl hydrolase family 2 [Olivibacter sp. SDN3]
MPIKMYMTGLMVVCLSVSCKKNLETYTAPEKVSEVQLANKKVQLAQNNGEWHLYKNGELFYIRGAAASASTATDPDYYCQLLSEYGGNAFRTYSVNENTQAMLDAAQAHGLVVALGLWVNREADNFDYDNEAAVQAQLEQLTVQVQQYKDHPALLMWYVGNEADASYTNTKLWDAINDICAMIHQKDPDHPVTTALVNSEQKKVELIKEKVTELDFLSINSYAPNLPSVITNLQAAEWDKPYIISEFGPRGTWQMNPEPDRILPWGNPKRLVEQTSTEKEQVYRTVFQDHIMANANNGCIGSFVFALGYQTHGEVLTWFGLNDIDGRAFGVLDAMHFCWTEEYPSNRAPQIHSRQDMLLNGMRAEDTVIIAPGSTNQATVVASDPDGDPLSYHWLIAPEGLGGPNNGPHPGIPNLIDEPMASEITFTAPGAGQYRLYVYVRDDHNKVASAVIPFLVE